MIAYGLYKHGISLSEIKQYCNNIILMDFYSSALSVFSEIEAEEKVEIAKISNPLMFLKR